MVLPPPRSSPPPRMTLEELFQALVSRKGRFFLLGVEWIIKPPHPSSSCAKCRRRVQPAPRSGGRSAAGNKYDQNGLNFMILFPLHDSFFLEKLNSSHLVSLLFITTHPTDYCSADSHRVSLTHLTYLIIRILALIISSHLNRSSSVPLCLLKPDT